MSTRRTRRLTGAVAMAATAVLGVALTSGPSTAAPKGLLVDLQILSFNDFHGNLEPPAGSGGRVIVSDNYRETPSGSSFTATADTVNAGGAAYLADHLARARAGKKSVTVAAGDIVGASPLLSAAFHDEPTVESMNALGLEATAVGNHEFDEGYQELLRLQRGGCIDDGAGRDNQDSCPGGKDFAGAEFEFLAANVKYEGKDKEILKPYWIKNFGQGVKVGFIGMTLKETPSIVTKAGIEGLTFTDEVETANALVPELRKKGVNAVVVLLHQGGVPVKDHSFTGPSGRRYSGLEHSYDWACAKGGSLVQDSAVLPIAAGLDPAIDMIVSGHTHQPYVCNVPDPAGQPRLVTSASSFGRLFTETNVQYDTTTEDIVRTSVSGSNMIVTRDNADATQTSLIATYKDLVKPVESKVIGTSVTSTVARSTTSAGESALGDLIADAQLNDASLVAGGGPAPQIAFMNPGGIRSDLISSDTDPAAGYDVTYGQAFSVQPFNNYVVAMTMTGAQIHQLLAQQWTGGNASSNKVLQVSEGFTYSWNAATKTVVPGSVKLKGVPVPNDASASYRVVANSFLSDGGDNFPAFAAATDKYFGGLDIDAFAAFISAKPADYPAAKGRISLG